MIAEPLKPIAPALENQRTARFNPPAPPAGEASGKVPATRNTVPAANSAESAREAAKDINELLSAKGSELTIEFDDQSDRVVFRLIDINTGEVLRQIPSKEVLAIARALAADGSAGILLRDNA